MHRAWPTSWFAFATSGLFLVQQFHALAAPPAGYDLSFSDEFSDSQLDPNIWLVDPSRPNVALANGALELTTMEDGDDWVEGHILTNRFTQRYGYYEASFKIGEETGLNNAFWLTTPHALGGSPFSAFTNKHDRIEVDIQEAHYSNKLTTNFHDWAPNHWGTGSGGTLQPAPGTDLSAGYHTYALEWKSDNTMDFYFDGQLIRSVSGSTVNNADSTIPVDVRFSTKVIPFAGIPGPNLDGTKMIVDYVRVYDAPGFTGAVNGNYGSGTNWGSGSIPNRNRAAIFNRATPFTTISVAQSSGSIDKEVRDFYFDGPEVPALTFIPRADTPDSKLVLSTVAAGGITLNEDVANTQTFDIPLVADGPITFSNFSRDQTVSLVLNGDIASTTPNREMTFLTTNTVEVGGSIESQFGDLKILGGGKVILSDVANHSGNTTIMDGTLALAGSASLPNSPLIEIQPGTTLDTSGLSGGLTVDGGQILDLRGDVIGSINIGNSSAAKGAGTIVGNLVAEPGASISPSGEFGTVAISAFRDVRIKSDDPDSNQGGTSWLMVGPVGSGSVLRTLLEFDLSGVPVGAELVGDPVLTLTGASDDSGSVSSSPTIEVRQLTTEFFEGQATWNRAKSGVLWQTPGGDLGSLLATTSGPNPDTWQAGDEIQFSAPSLRADIGANLGNANYDLALKTNTEALGQRSLLTFHSSESGTGPELEFSFQDTTGVWIIDGNYTQHGNATLEIDLVSGSTYDQVSATGSFTMDGVLDIDLSSTHSPVAGDAFDIFDFSSSIGMFDVLQFPALPNPLVWDASDLTTAGTLRIALDTSYSADFDLNGQVDSRDMAVWSTGYGISSGAIKSTGDADGDGDVDGQDFLILQRQLGSGVIQRVEVVPEPGSLCLFGLASVSICGMSTMRRLRLSS